MEEKKNYKNLVSFAAKPDIINWLKSESEKKHETVSNFLRQIIRREMEKTESN